MGGQGSKQASVATNTGQTLLTTDFVRGKVEVAPLEKDLRTKFAAAGQEHVFQFYDQGLISNSKTPAFLEQLAALDLPYISKSFKAAMADAAAGAANADLAPPDAVTCLADCTSESIQAWESLGLKAVGQGEVAACVLAGGQGTRLGFGGPKGCYNIGLPSGKSLFQIMVERVRRLVTLAQQEGFVSARLPLLVMTSPINDTETRTFFASNDWFGLSEDDVWFFQQGTLPCFTTEGKIILESADQISSSPDGNGGFYPALQKSGTMGRMKSAGIKYLHVFSVDNSLCRPADPCFVGFCISKNADVGNKCVWKANPNENVGVVAKRGGKPSVVEYSELDENHRNQRDENGRLLFGAGNICNHFYTIDFLADTVIPNCAGLFHLAHKKIPYAGPDGTTQKPQSNNGVKLEAFIFDVFSMSRSMAVLEASRSQEFAPVKNPPGDAADSPDTARTMFSCQCKQWFTTAGGSLKGDPDALFEISPLLSYRGEGLDSLASGKYLELPTHLETNLDAQ